MTHAMLDASLLTTREAQRSQICRRQLLPWISSWLKIKLEDRLFGTAVMRISVPVPILYCERLEILGEASRPKRYFGEPWSIRWAVYPFRLHPSGPG